LKNWISGEEVTYQYDSLERLTSAVTTGPEWGLSFSYDGFGNRTAQSVTKGSAPTSYTPVNPANNRLSAFSYDLNGNMTSLPSVTLSYDVDNRLSWAYHASNGSESYGYDPDNRRVWRKWEQDPSETEEYWFWGPHGEMMGVYRPFVHLSTLRMEQVRIERYFAGTRLNWKTDRLGSRDGNGYFPYGEERGTPTGNDTYKFATYWRDSTTGLDYADQRYYSSSYGRFPTPDPYVASGGPAKPSSWNRYSYVEADPVNHNDPRGLMLSEVGGGYDGSEFLAWAGTGLEYDPACPFGDCRAQPYSSPCQFNPFTQAPGPGSCTSNGLSVVPVSATEYAVALSPEQCAALGIVKPKPTGNPVIDAVILVVVAASALAELWEKLKPNPAQEKGKWDPNREAECDVQRTNDEAVCRTLPEPAQRARCWSSTTERWSNCMKGLPLPPLVTW
jgi:RHS repeat-associated protein